MRKLLSKLFLYTAILIDRNTVVEIVLDGMRDGVRRNMNEVFREIRNKAFDERIDRFSDRMEEVRKNIDMLKAENSKKIFN